MARAWSTSEGSQQLTPTATTSGTAAAISEGVQERLPGPQPVAVRREADPGRYAQPLQLRSQRLDLGQRRDGLDGQHALAVGQVEDGLGQDLESGAVEVPQLLDAQAVVAAVLRAVSQHRAVRADRGGHPPSPRWASGGLVVRVGGRAGLVGEPTLRRSSSVVSASSTPIAANPAYVAW